MGRTHKGLPQYVTSFADRHGRQRIRFKRQGWPSCYPKGRPGSAEFTQEYYAWLNAGPKQIGADKTVPGSFDDLISRYYQSQDFEALKPLTKKAYRSVLEQFRTNYGDLLVADMKAHNVTDILANMKGTPTQANNLRKRLGQLFKMAEHLRWMTGNPVLATKSLKVKSGGFTTWQEEQIAQFQAKWKLGTMPRLALDLALYTGQRRSDICDMGPGSIEGGRIRVVQEKTGRPLLIPMHADLLESIAATPHGQETYLITSYGKRFSYNGFGNWFLAKARDAGINGYEFHGLRKAAARRLAEAGCTNAEIKAITGHVTDAEVARYTREAEQESLANRAIQRLSRANPERVDQ